MKVVILAGGLGTRFSEETVKAAEKADVLMHECTYSHNLKRNADLNAHATAKEAGVIAREAHVKKLFLTHFSPRYKDEDLSALLAEARKEFDNTFVAKDFDKIEL